MNITIRHLGHGVYRLVVMDSEEVVKDIYEGSFRYIMQRVLHEQDPNTNLRIRADNRGKK